MSLAASWDHPDGTVAAAASEPAAGTPAAVVVELFTSEGCSSCPPADDVLREILGRQPFLGINVIGLGEHVDYWNRLGWRDPFSAAAFTKRQSDYEARAFRTGNIYTPQMVVDGRFQVIGSDRTAVLRAISQAAALPKATVDVLALAHSPTEVQVQIRVDVPVGMPRRGTTDVVVGLVEDGLATNVQRGENRGRMLKHSVVTRSLRTLGTVNLTDSVISQTASVPLDSAWSPSALQVVALLQERTTRHIIGAASTHIRPKDEPGQ